MRTTKARLASKPRRPLALAIAALLSAAAAQTFAAGAGAIVTTSSTLHKQMSTHTPSGNSGTLILRNASALSTTEAGGTASFSVLLSTLPSASVQVAIMSLDSSEGAIQSGANLVFDSNNWNVAQDVVVVGIDDVLPDGDITYVVQLNAVSSDFNFNGVGKSASVVNLDNEAATLIVTAAPNLQTTEAGANVSFTVALSAQPSAAVNVAAASFDSTEGQIISGGLLTFGPNNWNVAQVIVVAGVDDLLLDGDINYGVGLISNSSLSPFNGRSANVSLVNLDNDVANLVVTAAPNLQTTEAGANVSFTVALSAQPNASVNVASTTLDSTEGQISVGANLTFSPSNWNVAQTVVVIGVDDIFDDGDINYAVAIVSASSDSNFQARSTNVSVVNLDNDLTNTAVSIVNTDSNPVRLDEVITVTATVSEPLPGPDGISPTGLVTVRANTGEQCTFALPAASCNLPGFTSYGPRMITVTYAGDALHATGGNSFNQRIVRRADLSVDTLSVPSVITAGMALDYQTAVTNSGPDPAPLTRFINPTPTGLLAPVWTCVATNGASCLVASGNGAIDLTTTLPSGGTLLYTVSGTVATPVPAQIANTVQVFPNAAAPSYVFDPDTNDLTDTEIDVSNSLFADGFEGGLGAPEPAAKVATIDLSKASSGSVVITPTGNWTAARNHGIWPLAKLAHNGADRFNVDARFVGENLQVRISSKDAQGIWQFGEWSALPAKLWTLTWAIDANGAAQLRVQADAVIVQATLQLQLR